MSYLLVRFTPIFYFLVILLLVCYSFPFYIVVKIREDHLTIIRRTWIHNSNGWPFEENMIENYSQISTSRTWESVILWNRILVLMQPCMAKQKKWARYSKIIRFPYHMKTGTLCSLANNLPKYLPRRSTLMNYADVDSYSVSSFSNNSSDGSGGFDGGGFSDGGGGGRIWCLW